MKRLYILVFIYLIFTPLLLASQNIQLFDLYYIKFEKALQENNNEVLAPIYFQLEKKLQSLQLESQTTNLFQKEYEKRLNKLLEIKKHVKAPLSTIKKANSKTLESRLSYNSNQGSIFEINYSPFLVNHTEIKTHYYLLNNQNTTTQLIEANTNFLLFQLNSDFRFKLQQDDSNNANSFYQLQYRTKGKLNYLKDHTFSSFFQFRSYGSSQKQSSIFDYGLHTTIDMHSIDYGYYGNFSDDANNVFNKLYFRHRITSGINVLGFNYYLNNSLQQFFYNNTSNNQLFIQSQHLLRQGYNKISSRISFKHSPNNKSSAYFAFFNRVSIGNKYRPTNWQLSLDIKDYFHNNSSSYIRPGISKLIVQTIRQNYHRHQKTGMDIFLFGDSTSSYVTPFWLLSISDKTTQARFSNQYFKIGRRHQLETNSGSSWTLNYTANKAFSSFRLYYIAFDKKNTNTPDLIRLSSSINKHFVWKTLPLTFKLSLSQDIILIGSNKKDMDIDVQVYYKKNL